MGKAKYSQEYIAAVKAGTAELPTNKGEATYVKRLARNYEPGISRAQQRGHPRASKGEKPLSAIKKEQTAPAIPSQKPILSKSGKAGRKNLGRHKTKQYDQEGNVRRTRLNTRSTEILGKELGKTPDNQGVIIHLIGKDGRVIKAVGPGRKHTANAGDLKQRIAEKLAAGGSWDDAIFDAIGESFDLYDEQGNPVDISGVSFTNIIMYAEAA